MPNCYQFLNIFFPNGNVRKSTKAPCKLKRNFLWDRGNITLKIKIFVFSFIFPNAYLKRWKWNNRYIHLAVCLSHAFLFNRTNSKKALYSLVLCRIPLYHGLLHNIWLFHVWDDWNHNPVCFPGLCGWTEHSVIARIHPEPQKPSSNSSLQAENWPQAHNDVQTARNGLC